MQPLTELLQNHPLRDRVLSEWQLERISGGSAARRYGLVNRALKAGEMVRVRRGLYALAPRYRNQPLHPFAIAQAIAPGSYVSFETALAHHGWIPEAVRVIASVVPGRKSSEIEHPVFGSFSFHPLALERYRFLELIERKQFANQTTLIAAPIRALMDLVCLRKLEWQGPGFLTDGMRINPESLTKISATQIQTLLQVYKQRRSREFLNSLARELNLD